MVNFFFPYISQYPIIRTKERNKNRILLRKRKSNEKECKLKNLNSFTYEIKRR